MKTLFILAFLSLIIYNLGAALYYLVVDQGKGDRVVNALSWRIGLSILLIALVGLGMATGLIRGHGIGVG